MPWWPHLILSLHGKRQICSQVLLSEVASVLWLSAVLQVEFVIPIELFRSVRWSADVSRICSVDLNT